VHLLGTRPRVPPPSPGYLRPCACGSFEPNQLGCSVACSGLCGGRVVSSGDRGEPVSDVHVLDPAAQRQPADSGHAARRRRALPAAPRGVRQQDLEEHLAVRTRRPPRLRTGAGHAVRLRRDGVRQQLRVPGVEHGHDEDRAIGLLTTALDLSR